MDSKAKSQLQSLIDVFADEVESFPRETLPDWSENDFFAAVVLDFLADSGEVEDAIMCPYHGDGSQLNAYLISDDYERVDIFVSQYNTSRNPSYIANREVDAALMSGLSVYRRAMHDLHKSFQHDSDTYGFAVALKNGKKKIRNVNITLLTNCMADDISRSEIKLGRAMVSFRVFDIGTLFSFINPEAKRNIVKVNFVELTGSAIPCVENSCSTAYSSYLAILDGKTIALLYEKYGSRLLERNVRSFLQVRGAVNKGMRDTLRDEPEMFLAYNNGISVTAEKVDISRDQNGKPSINCIHDMQIVNGGQTTASIHNAAHDKKLNVDLSRVFIQMKLSVISSQENMHAIIPKISKFANTQNRIQIADFSANDPFHMKIEQLSQQIAVPTTPGEEQGYWFYERSRGQFNDFIANIPTPKERRLFKRSHTKFSKTDLAKYENSWDQLPHLVSEGAQKNFRHFTLRVQGRRNFSPDALYYKRLISKGILFKRTENLVSMQEFGGYRANIVTYTIASLSYHTAQRLDLLQIWEKQQLSEALENEITRISKLVQAFITDPPGGANISEWCKKEKCWETFKSLPFSLSNKMTVELLDVGKPNHTYASDSRLQGIEDATIEESELIDKVAAISPSTWFSLAKWAKETNNFEGWQRGIVYSVGTRVARKNNPSYKQSVHAWAVYNHALTLGFKDEGS